MRDWYTVARWPADGPEELSLVVAKSPWFPLLIETFVSWACVKTGHHWCGVVGRAGEWVDRSEKVMATVRITQNEFDQINEEEK